MNPTRTGHAPTSGGRIYWELYGPPGALGIMLFSSTSKGPWAHYVTDYVGLLADRFQVLVFDYPFSLGGSDRVRDPAITTATEFARHYLAVADAAGFDRFGYFGYSYGGNSGLQLAHQHPDRVAALIVGGFPALGGEYETMLQACVRIAKEPSAGYGELGADYAQQFVTYYTSLKGWDERAAVAALRMPRMNLVGLGDIGVPALGGAESHIGAIVKREEPALKALGWEVAYVDSGAQPAEAHVAGFSPDRAGPIVADFFDRHLRQA